MHHRLPLALLAAAVLCTSALGADKPQTDAITVTPQGLRIVKPAVDAAQNNNSELRPFNWFSGTSVSLLISAPKGGLIAVKTDDSAVTAFTDNQKTDLAKPAVKPQFGNDGAKFGGFPKISDDGKHCLIELEAPGLPAAGATQLLAKGHITVMTATVKKDFTAAKVALKKGTVIKAGAIALTIGKVGKPQWGQMAWEVELKADQKLDNIAKIAFLDGTGKEIESKRAGGSSMSFGTHVSITQDYQLKTKAEVADIVITYWMDAKTVKVPMDLKMGVGF